MKEDAALKAARSRKYRDHAKRKAMMNNETRPWSLARVNGQAKRCDNCGLKVVLPCLACRNEAQKRLHRLLKIADG